MAGQAGESRLAPRDLRDEVVRGAAEPARAGAVAFDRGDERAGCPTRAAQRREDAFGLFHPCLLCDAPYETGLTLSCEGPPMRLACVVLVLAAACGDNLDAPDAGGPDGPIVACGDDMITGTEVCDGTDLGGETCETRGWGPGTLACASDCSGFDESGCSAPPGCGNGVLAAPEQCDDGNTTGGDGCEANCQIGAGDVTVCRVVTPDPMVCTVTAGNAAKLITGTILTPGKVWRGGHVLLDTTGAIACVGCDCAGDAAAGGATLLDCPGAVVSPGLINVHDHITFTQNAPYTDTGERYEHRHDWRLGQNGHTEINTPGNASAAQIRWGELRFLLGGATSTVGSGSATGLLRNLDRADQEGLGQPPVQFDTFPLDDTGGSRRTADCNYGGSPTTPAEVAADDAYFPHVSEGIDLTARNEFLCMASDAYDTTTPGISHDLVIDKSAFIHGIGLFAPDVGGMAADGTALIWSPRSNITLYGDTAPVTMADRFGVLIALGTDWSATGSMNMLRELACADSLNQAYYNGHFTDAELWAMATTNGATAAAVDDATGVLAAGRTGDIAIFDGATGVDHRAVIAAEPGDVRLVLRGGEPLYGDDQIIAGLGLTTCDALDVCGVGKRVCLMDDIGQSLAQLQAAAGAIYPAFFCGTPMNEPSCTPTRPASVNGSTIYTGAITGTDPDGDGIETGDNCPDIFNPVRPVDAGMQADFDADGEGDVCDVCPLDADSTACTPFDPNDADSDGVPNVTDNCPAVPNPTQDDMDGDLKGDLCDACPNSPNPGTQGCPATIYEIKTGIVPVGANVSLSGALVTGRNASGFFLQVREDDVGYLGPDNSGIFVFSAGNLVAVGDRVTITSANIQDFFGQIQLSGVSGVMVTSSGEAPPAPILETPANVATGGSRAAALESVVVRVENVVVTSIAPPPGPGEAPPTNEFQVTGGLRVNDYLFLVTPFPAVSDSFSSITGVLELRNGNSKLEPRSAADLAIGAPALVSFAPASGNFARVGAVAMPTIPTPLTVTMSSAPSTDTFIAVTSSDPGLLMVAGGGATVLAGQTSAVVAVTGVAAGTVTLTASLDAVMLNASVRVIDATEVPVLVDLSPANATVPVGDSLAMTVTLDIPAPAGGTVIDLVSTATGAVPATVTVLGDQLSATFLFTAPGTSGIHQVSATLGATTLMATVEVVVQSGTLVINEVDYDQVGTDTTEYIELYNGSASAVSLANLAVVLVNGSNSLEYNRFDLAPVAATLPAGGYLVISNANVTIPGTALHLVLAAMQDVVQNGAPDGIALVDTSTMTVIDALSYEGSITAATITGFPGTVSLVEGTATPIADDNVSAMRSLARTPNGTDTDDAMADWAIATTLTPGAPN
jgi:cysteine-rich repeat protein